MKSVSTSADVKLIDNSSAATLKVGRLSSSIERELSKLPNTLSSQIRDIILDTNTINQGNASTCTQAALMYDLAKSSPLELVRIISELHRNGSCKLKDGTVVTLAKESYKKDIIPEGVPFKARSTAERIFQDSLFNAFSVNQNKNPYMSPERTKQMMNAVLGEPIITVGNRRDLELLIEHIKKNPLAASNDLKGTQLVLNFCNAGEHRLHAAQLTGARVTEDGSIKIRIFHGWGEGTTHGGVIVRSRDTTTGEEEIDINDLKSHIVAAHLPSSLKVVSQLKLTDTTSEMSIPATTAFLQPSQLWSQDSFLLEQIIKDEKKRRAEFTEEISKRK